MDRRSFLKTSSWLLGSASLAGRAAVFAGQSKPSGYFGVHPFVEQHPEAVFILRTQVDRKTNSAACKQVGLELGRTLFVPMDSTGVPVTHHIATKPNLTAHETVDAQRGFTLEDTMGITTDVFFVEGLFESLQELGVAGSRMHTRDVNGGSVLDARGYLAMGRRVGATVRAAKNTIRTEDDANDERAFVWREVPGGGVVYNQIPYLWPFNAPDAWNLNVAKFKAHVMGMTLTAKNWQGADAAPFQGYCQKWPGIDAMKKVEDAINRECLNPKVREAVEASFKRHTETIPRWNTPEVARTDPAYNGAYFFSARGMELWAQRTIDNHAASPMGLHIVEGIYGRESDFNRGPNPPGNENNYDGRARDYMTNVVIFGKNPYLVDIIGHWLSGHEPGNFGLFHVAFERGQLGVLNPMNIAVYEWQNGTAVRRSLPSFPRTPLRTSYIHQRGKEPLWHLVNEPFDYSKVSERKRSIPPKPTARALSRHWPNAASPQLAIEYSVPEKGRARVEILDASGKTLEVVSNTLCDPGYHMAAWNTAKYASGSYKCRLRYNGVNVVQDLLLNKS
jgi:hypothetical protein